MESLPVRQISFALKTKQKPVLFDLALDQQDDQERIEERLAHIADHLGFSWTGKH